MLAMPASYRLRGEQFQLTEDHRVWDRRSRAYLARALGMDRKVEIDYPLQLEAGDLFLLATDGVYEHRCPVRPDAAIAAAPISTSAAPVIADEAGRRGSGDNPTVQLVRIDELSEPEANEVYRQVSTCCARRRPRCSALKPEGHQIVRETAGSAQPRHLLRLDGETASGGDQDAVRRRRPTGRPERFR